MQAYASRWIYVAVIYFLVAIGFGMFMSISTDFTWRSVHAHLNLVGWVSMALIGVIYHFFPKAGASRVATAQFWFHQTGLPIMMVALAIYLKGHKELEPLIALGSVLVLVSILLFAGNLLSRRG